MPIKTDASQAIPAAVRREPPFLSHNGQRVLHAAGVIGDQSIEMDAKLTVEGRGPFDKH